MNQNNSFKMAMAVSLATHIAIFSCRPSAIALPTKKTLEKFEVSYYRVEYGPRKDAVKAMRKAEVIPAAKAETRPKPEKPKAVFRINKKPVEQKPAQPEKKAEKKENALPSKPKETKVVVKEANKKVEVTQRPQGEPQGKAYLDYYELLRRKIKDSIGYPTTNASGAVQLIFTIAQDGRLKDVYIDTARSTENPSLRDAAVYGIKDAAPFPPFPEGLSQDVQSFNVIISFEPKR